MINTPPRISIILPVLHEAENINTAITHLRGLKQDNPCEIIVVDGDPAGGTLQAIRDREVVQALSGPGRAAQMNHGASLANGEILLFLHADTQLPPNALSSISALFTTPPRAAAGAFNLGIRSPRGIFRITERYVAWRTHLTLIPFGDQAIFIKRSCFVELGGYRNIPIMEDVDLMKRIKQLGKTIMILPDRVMTSARRWEREGILYCTLRNWLLQLLFGLGVPPAHLAKLYR